MNFRRIDGSSPLLGDISSKERMIESLVKQGVRVISARRDPSLQPSDIDVLIQGTHAECNFGDDAHKALTDVVEQHIPPSRADLVDLFKDALKYNKPIMFGIRMIGKNQFLEPLGIVKWP